MFTGIVQDIGVVEFVENRQGSCRLGIRTKLLRKHLKLGASVSCNGCCLTVTQVKICWRDNIFFADVGPQTLQLTNLSNLKKGDKINLEPALCYGDALGGHTVTGHIDGVFPIVSFSPFQQEETKQFWKLSLNISKEFARYLLPQGSLAVAGISLTIAGLDPLPCGGKRVDIMIVPQTREKTILQFLLANDSIDFCGFDEKSSSSLLQIKNLNVEFDLSVKTVASLLENMIVSYTQMNHRSAQG